MTTPQREYIEQRLRTGEEILNFEHFRELGRYEGLLRLISNAVDTAVTEQGKLRLYPPGDKNVTMLIQNCHILNTALENISDMLIDFNKPKDYCESK